MNRKEFKSLRKGELLKGGISLELVMFMGMNSHGGYDLLPIAITGHFIMNGALIPFSADRFEHLKRIR